MSNKRKRITKEDLKKYEGQESDLEVECFFSIYTDGTADITLFNIYTPDGMIRLKDSFRLPLSKLEWNRGRGDRDAKEKDHTAPSSDVSRKRHVR